MGKYQTYPDYTQTKTDWLGVCPSHWQIIPVGRLFSRIKRTDHIDKELLSVYRDYGVIPKSSRDDNNNKPSEDLSPYQLVKPNDLVMNKMKTWQGSIAISEYEGIVSPAYFVYQPLSKLFDVAHPKYVHYLLRNPMYIAQYLRRSKGIRVSQWDLDPDEFQRVELLLPTKDEQLKIFQFLDHETAKIDTLIEKQQQLIALLKEKRQAVISHAVTKGLNPDAPMRDSGVEWLGEVPEHWEVISIKHLSSVKRGASPRPIDDQKYFDDSGDYAWVRIADVSKAGMYLTSTTQRLSELGSSLSVKLEADELFVSIAGTVGKPCLTISKACIHDGFVYFPDLKINNKFLYYIFEAGEAYLGLGKMGTQLNLNTDSVGGIKIGLPPLNEIGAIINIIEKSNIKYDDLINKANKSISLMQERRTALISAAVTGKIDVRKWAENGEGQ